MGTIKEELKKGLAGLIHAVGSLEEPLDIHFEIGWQGLGEQTRCIYGSKSLAETMKEYAKNGWSEKDGYYIDAWEGGNPVADIMANGHVTRNKKARPQAVKVHFEINKRTVSDIPEVKYDWAAVFKSDSAFECRDEWGRKEYSQPEYSFDIREARDGKESYHVADIDISSFDVLSSVRAR